VYQTGSKNYERTSVGERGGRMTDRIIITILYVLYIALWVVVAICLHKDSRNEKGDKEND
jgi:hypothetical protein